MTEGEGGPRPEMKEKQKPYRVEMIVQQGARNEQQDAGGFKEIKEGSRRVLVVAVADGHGFSGTESAERAVAFALSRPDALKDEAATKMFFQEAQKLVIQAGRDAFKKTLAESGSKWSEDEIIDDGNGGTTLTVVRVDGQEATIAYVGDSEVGIVQEDGTIESLTPPHHPLQAGERDRLKATGAQLSGPRLEAPKSAAWAAVSRALGDTEFEPHLSHEPAVVKTTCGERDRFLLVASDGLWGKLDGQHRRALEDAMVRAKTPGMAKRRIEALLSEWPENDNVYIAIVELPRSGK